MRRVREQSRAGDVADGPAETHRPLRQRLFARGRHAFNRATDRARRGARALPALAKANLRAVTYGRFESSAIAMSLVCVVYSGSCFARSDAADAASLSR